MTLLAGAKLLTQTLSLSTARVAGSGANFVAQLLLARSMGTADLGLFYIVTSMAILLGAVASIGYPGIANHLIERYAARRQNWKMKAFVLTARRDSLVVALCIALGGVAAIAISSNGDPKIVWPAAIAALAIPAFATIRVNGGIANALHRFALSILPSNFIQPVLFTLTVGMLVLTTGSLSLLSVVCAFSALVITIAIAQTLIVGWSGGAAGPASKPDRREVKNWRKSGCTLLVPILLMGLFADLSISFSGLLLEPAQVAIFSICVKVAFMFGFFVQVVNQISLPRFAKSLRAKNKPGIDDLLTKVNIVATGMMILALLASLVAGSEILGMFGADFRSGFSVLLILVSAQLVRALGGPALPLLIASGRHKLSIPPIVASAAVFAAVACVLTPMIGMTGMALAVFAAITVSSAGLAIVIRRELGFSCDVLSRLQSALPSSGLIHGHISERKLT